MSKKNWIGSAVKHPGKLKASAKKNGRSTLAEAKVEAKSPDKKTASRGRLALRFIGKAKRGNINKAKKNTHKRTSRKV